MHELERQILAAIDSYNRHRTPVAGAKFVEADDRGKKMVIDFSGSFCTSCNPYSYLNDFTVEAKKSGLRIEIERVEHRNEYLRVRFAVK